jgi:hypothetical protein
MKKDYTFGDRTTDAIVIMVILIAIALFCLYPLDPDPIQLRDNGDCPQSHISCDPL